MSRQICCIALVILLSAPFAMCIGGGDSPQTIKVICAGSLVAPFEALEVAFEEIYPGYDVQIEAHGSIQVIRQVTELGRTADVLAVADYSLIPMLMYGGEDPHATWYVQFATNKLGLAYRPDSAYASELSAETWYEVLAREDVVLGLSDPRFDASGYRTLMILKLAEYLYENDTILGAVLGDAFSPPVRVTEDEHAVTLTVPEIFESSTPRIALRGSSVQLLSLLEGGAIDYAFEYENVARYYGLSYLQLPPSIDLSSEDIALVDKELLVDLAFQRFSSVTPLFVAQKTYYAVTIPRLVENEEGALLFTEFLLSEEGRACMEDTFLETLTDYITDNPLAVPDSLVPYL